VPFRTTVWLASIVPTIRSGCTAHVEAQVTNKRKHKVRKKKTERRPTAPWFDIADSIIPPTLNSVTQGYAYYLGKVETDGPIIVEGNWHVNVIIRLHQTLNRKGNSCAPFPDSESENASAYLRDLGGLSLDP
jgi:hypothetical protein